MLRFRKRALLVLMCFIALSSGAMAAEPHKWQMGFQPAVTPVMHAINDLHNALLVLITVIALFVAVLLLFVIVRFNKKRNPTPSKTTHHTPLEVVWTAVPALIVLALLFPSLKTLYFMDQVPEADLTVKITGHQWFWSYTYPDNGNFSFDSYMKQDKDLGPDDIRLLSVDNQMVIPVGKTIRLQTTSADVIHSWALPAFGVKKDSVPGKLSEYWIRVEKEGTYRGQCSELCGPGHGFMPIVVKVVSQEDFDAWVKDAETKFSDNRLKGFNETHNDLC